MLSENDISDSINTTKKFEYYRIFRTFGFFLLFFGINYALDFLIVLTTTISVLNNWQTLLILLLVWLLYLLIAVLAIIFIYIINKEKTKLQKIEISDGKIHVQKLSRYLLALYIFLIIYVSFGFIFRELIDIELSNTSFYFLIDQNSIPIFNIILIIFLYLLMNKILRKNYETKFKILFVSLIGLFIVYLLIQIFVFVSFFDVLQGQFPPEYLVYLNYAYSSILFLLAGYLLIRKAKYILSS